MQPIIQPPLPYPIPPIKMTTYTYDKYTIIRIKSIYTKKRIRHIYNMRAMLLILLLLSCGETNNYTPPYFGPSHPGYEQYKETFIDALYHVGGNTPHVDNLSQLTRNIPIVINEDIGAVANCTRRNGIGLGIRVDKRWSGSPNIERIIWHELGHCILNLDHHPSRVDLMHESISPYFKEPIDFNFIVRYFDNIQ